MRDHRRVERHVGAGAKPAGRGGQVARDSVIMGRAVRRVATMDTDEFLAGRESPPEGDPGTSRSGEDAGPFGCAGNIIPWAYSRELKNVNVCTTSLACRTRSCPTRT